MGGLNPESMFQSGLRKENWISLSVEVAPEELEKVLEDLFVVMSWD